jgi:hypothetical protein
MLDNIKQNNDIERTDSSERSVVGHSMQHVQAGAPSMPRRLGGQFDPGHVEITRGLLEKEPVGAAQLQKLACAAVVTDEIHAAREFAA